VSKSRKSKQFLSDKFAYAVTRKTGAGKHKNKKKEQRNTHVDQ